MNRLYTWQYRTTRDYMADSPRMHTLGYRATSIVPIAGHINWGRTVLRAIFTGGIGLLFGPSRTPASVIVTWELTPAAAPSPALAPDTAPAA